MYLYHCIFIGVPVILSFFTESVSHNIVPLRNRDQDDSLSIKYNMFHEYTTSDPLKYSTHITAIRSPQNFLQMINYQNFQYAPLPSETEMRHLNQKMTPKPKDQDTELYKESDTPNLGDDSDVKTDSLLKKEQKINLLPNVDQVKTSNVRPRKYVPGYNVDLQALNNKLTQNGLYAVNPNMLVKNKQINVNYLQPQLQYQKQDNVQRLPKNAQATRDYLKLRSPQDVKTHPRNIHSEARKNEQLPFVYVKAPKVDLNLAQAQNAGRAGHKGAVNVNSNFKIQPLPVQELFSNIKNLNPPNTQLHPVKHSKINHRTA